MPLSNGTKPTKKRNMEVEIKLESMFKRDRIENKEGCMKQLS